MTLPWGLLKMFGQFMVYLLLQLLMLFYIQWETITLVVNSHLGLISFTKETIGRLHAVCEQILRKNIKFIRADPTCH